MKLAAVQARRGADMVLVTAGEMQEIDRQTIESSGIPGRVLMENAGRGAAAMLCHQFSDLKDRRIGIAAGKGNNGGDGFVIARCLAQQGLSVTVYLLAKREKVRGDAAANLSVLPELNVPIVEIPDEEAFSRHEIALRHQTLWVDAILGTGLESDVKGLYRTFIAFLNDSGKPIFAVDIPSGLNSDTGQPCGTCVRADATATFAFAKSGHHLYPGVAFTGNLQVIDIGIPSHIVARVDPKQHLLSNDMIRSHLIPRAPDAHKGDTGHLLVIAGSTGKTGAAAMTAMAAMRSGTGLVSLAIPRSLNAILESQVLEAMTCPLPETTDGQLDPSAFKPIMDLLSEKKCLAIGPGLGMSAETHRLVRQIIRQCPCPMVIDADGLNSLVGETALLKDLSAPAILTPHPGEMARLTGKTTTEIQNDRMGCARRAAEKYQVHVVLKGARTIVAHPDGSIYVNPTGNSGMASGGMGDVLTGLIAGLISQGYGPEAATHVGVYLHGMAADILADTLGPIGFLAGDVINRIPEAIKDVIN